MITLAICQNPLCPRPNREFEPTRKNNVYCSPACRQAALRNRQKESQETLLDQRLRKLPISVASMIKSISEEHAMEAAMQALSAVNLLLNIADAWPKEIRELIRPDQQKMFDLEAELARYRQICDMSDRKKLEDRFMALGAAFQYHRLINYNVRPGEEHWLTFMQGADDATLAAALVNTGSFYFNWMFFVEATDLKKAERRIAELEQTIQRYAIADQKAKEAITELMGSTNRSSNRIESLEQELERANKTIEHYEFSQRAMNDAEEQRWRELRQAFMELGERRAYQPMDLAHLRTICPGLVEDIGEGKDRWEWASESFDQAALMVVLTSNQSQGIESGEEIQEGQEQTDREWQVTAEPKSEKEGSAAQITDLERRLAVSDTICHESALVTFFLTESFVPIQRDDIIYQVFTAEKKGHAVAKIEGRDGFCDLDLTDEEMAYARDYAYQGMLKRYEETLWAKASRFHKLAFNALENIYHIV